MVPRTKKTKHLYAALASILTLVSFALMYRFPVDWVVFGVLSVWITTIIYTYDRTLTEVGRGAWKAYAMFVSIPLVIVGAWYWWERTLETAEQYTPLSWILIPGFLVWSALVVFFSFRARKKHTPATWRTRVLLFATAGSFFSLILLVESGLLVSLLGIAAAFCMYTVFFWHEESTDSFILYEYKSFRRYIATLWTFHAYAFMSGLFALSLFFPSIPFWLISLIAGVILAGIAVLVWQLYIREPIQRFVLWFVILALATGELFFVTKAFPVGYLVAGLIVTWVWYVLQLLLRFHFSPQGILWKKQRWFLASNAALFALFFLFVFRWI